MSDRPTFEEIAGAVARGWCAPENAMKEMDSDLAYAITGEIETLLNQQAAKGEAAQARIGTVI